MGLGGKGEVGWGNWEGVRLGGEMGEVWWGKSEGEVGVVGCGSS